MIRGLPDWEDVLSAASRLQEIVPDTVLVGGTATAVYADHRRSADADHTLGNLREHFDEVLADLESVAGWRTARVTRPVLILGKLDGIETGVRQLIRLTPLETEKIHTIGGAITLPTKPEVLRIKGSLILKRNATRDYVDFIALADVLGDEETADAMSTFDAIYPQPNEQSAIRQLMVQLASPQPFDRDGIDLRIYKGIADRYNNWEKLEVLGSRIAKNLFDRMIDDSEATHDNGPG